MAYPSTLSAIATPQSTDRLNNPSHSQLHQNENSAILEIERFVGTDSSIAGTLVNDIRSPSSDGGGHVQTAITGGTGQTTFTKGDILVGQSSSVLSKLAISSVIGNALLVDPSQALGVRWGNVVANKIAVKSSVSGTQNSSVETVLFSASVLGSTLGTNNAIRFTGFVPNFSTTTTGVSWVVYYGNNSVLSIDNVGSDDMSGLQGTVSGTIIADNSRSAQKGFMNATFTSSETEKNGDATVEISKYMANSYGTSSVVSDAPQDLIVTVKFVTATPAASIQGQFFVVERIS